ncbi:LamG domain-containing protein [Candidatus Parvarchaeota archaeon]|nr:LamG domain-containing protein [Candidatus Parvarchaeota archaeon]
MSLTHKSQSALEYMMTYGWAILIIVIVAAVLYSFGIFSPSSSISATITGFSGAGVTAASCINSVNNQILALSITDNTGYLINITKINTTGNNGIDISQNVGSILSNGDSAVFYVNEACNKSSSSYSASVTITYTEPGQPLPGPYLSTGKIANIQSNSNLDKVAKFNGLNSIITTPLLFRSNTFTVVYWVNGQSTSKMTSGNGYTMFGSNGTNSITSFLNNGGGAGASCGLGDEEIGLNGSFDHGLGVNGGIQTMVTISVSNGTVTYYVNSTGPCVGSAIPRGIYSLNYITFGGVSSGGNNYGISFFNGTLANFQLYDNVLSPSFVNSLFSHGIGSAPIPNAGLVGWWPLDGNANDYSGNNNNGVAINVQWVSP